MVQHVMLLYFFPKIPFKVKMVNGIVGYIIKQVSQYKAGEKSKDVINGQDRFKQEIK
jgi:hypothetical protein